MTTLEKRITELEAKAPADEQLLIVRFIVDADAPPRPVNRARAGDEELTRGDDETEEAFIERAKQAARAAVHPRSVAQLLLWPNR